MKQFRNGTFETNSSSAHSCILINDNEYTTDKEIETYILQATSLKLPRKKLPPINSTTYDGLSNRGSWDNLFRQATKNHNKNELIFVFNSSNHINH